MNNNDPTAIQPDQESSSSNHPQKPKKRRSFLAFMLLSPEERRLRAGWRLLLQMMAQNALLFGVIILLMLIPWRINVDDLFLGQIGMLLSVTISVFLARILLDRRSIVSLGLRISLRAFLDICVGFIIAGLMMAFIYILEWHYGWLSFENYAWENQTMQTIIPEVLLILLIFVIVGWQEELLSRGYQLQNLTDGLNLTWGVVLSSVIFGLMHMGNPNVSITAILGLIASGFFLAYAFLRTNLLWLPIGIHIGWNFFEGVVFGFPVSGLETFRLIQQTVNGPEIITGGKFGPEAGLILIPGLALGFLLVTIYSRKRIKYHPSDKCRTP